MGNKLKLLFSQRKGLKPIKNVMQIDSMDKDLRNSLWSALLIHYWEYMKHKYSLSSEGRKVFRDDIITLCEILWMGYFKSPIDTLSIHWEEIYKRLRTYFFECKWFEVYDFIEFVANYFPATYPYENTNTEFIDICNTILKREMSAYRFVGGRIVQITSEEEISEIEEALNKSFFEPVNVHLREALDKISDRKSPDYRNSIKESISSVEALCNFITKKPKATLGNALREIEKKVDIHKALKSAFSSLYGYTSDAQGIRHALMDVPNLDFEDAKFMLVACSAFINYLIPKASKAGIKF